MPEKSDWINAATKETGLPDPLSELSWQVTQELSFLPLYDQSDSDAIQYNESFALPSSAQEFRNPRFWLNLPSVAVADADAANKIALDHLTKGADGIFFFGTTDIKRRLETIDLKACTVSFPLSDHKDVEAIALFLREQSDPQHMNFLWESTPLRPWKLLDHFGRIEGVRALGVMVNPGNVVTEIADALFNGVTLIDMLTDAGFDPRDVLPHIHFSLATSSDFFTTMAKLRAIRRLWYQVIRAYRIEDFTIDQIFIHARCNPLKDARFEPRGALISNTTTSIAAVCGGCDAITIFPEENETASSDRIARNVSTILADEAHMNKVADPFAGSYFVEKLVHDLSNASWNVFKSRF